MTGISQLAFKNISILTGPFRLLNNISGSDKDKLTWLVRLRWLAILTFSFLTVPGYIFDFLGRQSMLLYIGTLALLSVFNLLVQMFWSQPQAKPSPYFIFLQLSIDLICLSTLLLISGGYENPLIPLFFFHAALGGLLIRGNLSPFYLLLVHALLGFVQVESWLANIAVPVIPHQQLFNHFVVDHFLIFIFWFVLRSVGYYFEKQIQHQVKIQSRDLIHNEKRDRLKALGALAAGFSHEFASPLSTIKIRFLRIERQLLKLQNQKLSDAICEDLSQAQLAIDQCEMILRQMNSSQLDIRSFQTQKVLLGDLLKNICQSWRQENPQALLQVNILFDCFVEISALNFAQVILNLLDNAYEVNSAGCISVILNKVADAWMLEVQDTGSGFTQNVLSRVGEPFITEKQNGTGLGLYVTDLFMQSVSGQMNLKNTQHGACVSLTWPIGEVAHEA